MRVARAGQSALQIPHHIRDRPVFLARDRAQRPPVMLLRFDPDGLEQYGGGHVVSVRDERYAHPGADRLILRAQAARVTARPDSENQRPGNGQAEGYRQNQ